MMEFVGAGIVSLVAEEAWLGKASPSRLSGFYFPQLYYGQNVQKICREKACQTISMREISYC